jgi:hypothetical protein
MDNSNGGKGPDEDRRETVSTFIIVLFLLILGLCGYCAYFLLKLIIEGVAAGLSQLSTLSSGVLIKPCETVYLIGYPANQPDVYTMTAARLEPLLSIATVVGYVLLGAVIAALIGIGLFVALSVYKHIRDEASGDDK